MVYHRGTDDVFGLIPGEFLLKNCWTPNFEILSDQYYVHSLLHAPVQNTPVVGSATANINSTKVELKNPLNESVSTSIDRTNSINTPGNWYSNQGHVVPLDGPNPSSSSPTKQKKNSTGVMNTTNNSNGSYVIGALCDEQFAKHMFRQLISGLSHLHERLEMAHLDLKLDNLMIDTVSLEPDRDDFEVDLDKILSYYQNLKVPGLRGGIGVAKNKGLKGGPKSAVAAAVPKDQSAGLLFLDTASKKRKSTGYDPSNVPGAKIDIVNTVVSRSKKQKNTQNLEANGLNSSDESESERKSIDGSQKFNPEESMSDEESSSSSGNKSQSEDDEQPLSYVAAKQIMSQAVRRKTQRDVKKRSSGNGNNIKPVVDESELLSGKDKPIFSSDSDNVSEQKSEKSSTSPLKPIKEDNCSGNNSRMNAPDVSIISDGPEDLNKTTNGDASVTSKSVPAPQEKLLLPLPEIADGARLLSTVIEESVGNLNDSTVLTMSNRIADASNTVDSSMVDNPDTNIHNLIESAENNVDINTNGMVDTVNIVSNLSNEIAAEEVRSSATNTLALKTAQNHNQTQKEVDNATLALARKLSCANSTANNSAVAAVDTPASTTLLSFDAFSPHESFAHLDRHSISNFECYLFHKDGGAKEVAKGKKSKKSRNKITNVGAKSKGSSGQGHSKKKKSKRRNSTGFLKKHNANGRLSIDAGQDSHDNINDSSIQEQWTGVDLNNIAKTNGSQQYANSEAEGDCSGDGSTSSTEISGSPALSESGRNEDGDDDVNTEASPTFLDGTHHLQAVYNIQRHRKMFYNYARYDSYDSVKLDAATNSHDHAGDDSSHCHNDRFFPNSANDCSDSAMLSSGPRNSEGKNCTNGSIANALHRDNQPTFQHQSISCPERFRLKVIDFGLSIPYGDFRMQNIVPGQSPIGKGKNRGISLEEGQFSPPRKSPRGPRAKFKPALTKGVDTELPSGKFPALAKAAEINRQSAENAAQKHANANQPVDGNENAVVNSTQNVNEISNDNMEGGNESENNQSRDNNLSDTSGTSIGLSLQQRLVSKKKELDDAKHKRLSELAQIQEEKEAKEIAIAGEMETDNRVVQGGKNTEKMANDMTLVQSTRNNKYMYKILALGAKIYRSPELHWKRLRETNNVVDLMKVLLFRMLISMFYYCIKLFFLFVISRFEISIVFDIPHRKFYIKKVDVWACGVILFKILFGDSPKLMELADKFEGQKRNPMVGAKKSNLLEVESSISKIEQSLAPKKRQRLVDEARKKVVGGELIATTEKVLVKDTVTGVETLLEEFLRQRGFLDVLPSNDNMVVGDNISVSTAQASAIGEVLASSNTKCLCGSLLLGLLEVDPDKRLTLQQIREHPWVKRSSRSSIGRKKAKLQRKW